jgi:hypothetical protein
MRLFAKPPLCSSFGSSVDATDRALPWRTGAGDADSGRGRLGTAAVVAFGAGERTVLPDTVGAGTLAVVSLAAFDT